VSPHNGEGVGDRLLSHAEQYAPDMQVTAIQVAELPTALKEATMNRELRRIVSVFAEGSASDIESLSDQISPLFINALREVVQSQAERAKLMTYLKSTVPGISADVIWSHLAKVLLPKQLEPERLVDSAIEHAVTVGGL
jgi:hypothetical protein